MTTCNNCKKEMSNEVDSCTYSKKTINGKIYARISGDLSENNIDGRCTGCLTLLSYGNYHHYGCPREGCPACGDQIAYCRCEQGAFS